MIPFTDEVREGHQGSEPFVDTSSGLTRLSLVSIDRPVDAGQMYVLQFLAVMAPMFSLTRFSRRHQGFTLIEMLVVAALISLFAGLALFSIQSAMEQNKQKAAVAECRQIATAMGFAQQDVGFFPKLAFLRFNSTNLLQVLTPSPTTLVNGLEANSFFVSNLESRIVKNWKGIYSALNQSKLVKMQFESAVETVASPGVPTGTASLVVDWPADPWNNPYALYLVKTIPAGGLDPLPRQSFLENSGDRANHFAGVVSYGRNGVPGLGDEPPDAERTARLPLRLYEQIDRITFRLLNPTELTQARLDMILNQPVPDPIRPRIRELGSDDRFAEF